MLRTFALLLSTLHGSQLPDANVPAAARHAWEARYSGPHGWTAGRDHDYFVAFAINGGKAIAHYGERGDLLDQQVVVPSFDLPDGVRKAVVTQLRGYHILESWRVDRSGAPTEYVVEADKLHEAIALRFRLDGTIVSRVTHPVTHHVVN